MNLPRIGRSSSSFYMRLSRAPPDTREEGNMFDSCLAGEFRVFYMYAKVW